MRVEIPPKNQIKIISSFVIVAILITIILLFKENLFIVDNNIEDNERFYMEYNQVTVQNPFIYVTAKEAIELFNNEQAIIFFGFKECKWCQNYVPILNGVALEHNIQTIYYCNIKEDRANNTEEYQRLLQMLNDYLYSDDNGNKRIYVPDVYFVKDGKIQGHNNDTSIIEGSDTEEYYTETVKLKLKEKLTELLKKVYNSTEYCNDSGKGC